MVSMTGGSPGLRRSRLIVILPQSPALRVTHGVRVARTGRCPWNLTSLSLSRRVSRADSFTDTTLSWASLLLGVRVKLKGGTGGRARRHAPAGH